MFDIGVKKFRNVANGLYARMVPLLLVRARSRVRLWFQDSLGTCDTPFILKQKKKNCEMLKIGGMDIYFEHLDFVNRSAIETKNCIECCLLMWDRWSEEILLEGFCD